MNRAALLVAGLLTLSACSTGDDAEPPPPLDTEAPTTTIEPPAPETTTTTSTTTTTVVETTTTAAATTTTGIPEIANPPADLDAAYETVFEDYAEGWSAKRLAFRDPSNSDLRTPLTQFYTVDQLSGVIETLDQQVAKNSVSVDLGDDSQQVSLLAGISFVESTSALIVVCEVLTDSIVSTVDGSVEYEGLDASTNQVFLTWNEDRWVVASETSDKVESGTECT